MADDIDSDALRAEIEFVEERIRDPESAHHVFREALGEALSTDIWPDHFTPRSFA